MGRAVQLAEEMRLLKKDKHWTKMCVGKYIHNMYVFVIEMFNYIMSHEMITIY